VFDRNDGGDAWCRLGARAVPATCRPLNERRGLRRRWRDRAAAYAAFVRAGTAYLRQRT
jgi:hypothetical protein